MVSFVDVTNRLYMTVFSCVHDCIFLSNSVGHDSLSSRLI